MRKQSSPEIELHSLKGKQILKWTSILTLVLLIVTVFTMGGGHGTYFFGKLFYPISMIIAGLNDKITEFAIWMAILQIPIYGVILYLIRDKTWNSIGIGILFLIHILLFVSAWNFASGFN